MIWGTPRPNMLGARLRAKVGLSSAELPATAARRSESDEIQRSSAGEAAGVDGAESVANSCLQWSKMNLCEGEPDPLRRGRDGLG